jgi:hypothetical protein
MPKPYRSTELIVLINEQLEKQDKKTDEFFSSNEL